MKVKCDTATQQHQRTISDYNLFRDFLRSLFIAFCACFVLFFFKTNLKTKKRKSHNTIRK